MLQTKHYHKKVQNESEILITRGIVDAASPGEYFEVDSVYSSYHNLAENDYLPDDGMAVVQFDRDGAALEIKLLSEYEFDEEPLQQEFPITLEGNQRIPTDYYPFDVEDEDHQQFIISILQSTVHLALEKKDPGEGTDINITAEELLSDAHPLWVDIDDDKKQAFRSRAEDILSAYSRHGLREHIKKAESSGQKEWKVISKSLQALQRKIDEFIEAMEVEMQQTELDDWTSY